MRRVLNPKRPDEENEMMSVSVEAEQPWYSKVAFLPCGD